MNTTQTHDRNPQTEPPDNQHHRGEWFKLTLWGQDEKGVTGCDGSGWHTTEPQTWSPLTPYTVGVSTTSPNKSWIVCSCFSSQTDPNTRTRVSKTRSNKPPTNLYVCLRWIFSISLLSQHCACALVGFDTIASWLGLENIRVWVKIPAVITREMSVPSSAQRKHVQFSRLFMQLITQLCPVQQKQLAGKAVDQFNSHQLVSNLSKWHRESLGEQPQNDLKSKCHLSSKDFRLFQSHKLSLGCQKKQARVSVST